jgi:hypothetical protein
VGLGIVLIFPYTLPFNLDASCLSRYFEIVRARAGSPTVILIHHQYSVRTSRMDQGLEMASLFDLRFVQNGGQDGIPSHLRFLESLGGNIIQGWTSMVSRLPTSVGDDILHCANMDRVSSVRRW